MPARPSPAARPPADPWELRAVGGMDLLVCPALETLGVDVVVTGRSGGVSTGPFRSLNLGLHVGDDRAAVMENRRRAVAAIGARLDDLVVGRQVHGAAVAVVTEADRGRGAMSAEHTAGEVDALVTDRPGPVLAVLAADCVPMVLWEPAAGVLATCHAGWRGTAAGVVEATIAAMGRLGARPARIVAGVGPAVSAQRYQVGDEVAGAMGDRLGGGASAVLTLDGPGHWLLDLPGAVRRLLGEVGVPAAAVHATAATTGNGGPFFSDRQVRPCGRFALLARLRR